MEDAPYVEPDGPVGRWSVKQCKDWLKFHDLNAPKAARVVVLCQLIVAAKGQPGGPPSVIGAKGGPACNVESVLITLSAMMSLCMGPEQCHPSYPSVLQ